MKSNKEIADLAHTKAKRIIERKKRQNQYIYSGISVAAACLVVVSLSMLMPSFDNINCKNNIRYKTMATIFGNSNLAGYLIVGFTAFALGIVVTILCRKFIGEKEDRND